MEHICLLTYLVHYVPFRRRKSHGKCLSRFGIKNVQATEVLIYNIRVFKISCDRLCGLVVRVLGYRSGGPGPIPGTTRKKRVVGLERGPLSLVSTTEELLERKVAALV
jgi:hypothetical protein